MPKCKKDYTPDDLRFVQDSLYVLGGKWKLDVIRAIGQGNSRFGEIQKSLPKISTRTLTLVLKELEANHIILRTIIDDLPPVISYTFTEYSKALVPMIDSLIEWAGSHRKEILGKGRTAAEK